MGTRTREAFIADARRERRRAHGVLLSHPERPWSSNSFKILYDPRHREALQIERWQGNGMVVPEGIRETDWDHLESMRKLYHTDFKKNCRAAFKELHGRTVHIMIMSHDSLEIIAGDLPFMIDDPLLRRRKEFLEDYAAHLFTGYLQDNPALPELARCLSRYKNKEENPFDKEAQMVKFLDCLQPNLFAFENNLYQTISDPTEQHKHVTRGAYQMMHWGIRLVNALDSEDAKSQVQNYIDMQIERFYTEGFGYEMHDAMDMIIREESQQAA